MVHALFLAQDRCLTNVFSTSIGTQRQMCKWLKVRDSGLKLVGSNLSSITYQLDDLGNCT